MTIDENVLYKNPLIIQKTILEEFEKRLGGEVTVADPNNPFCFLIEAFSQITASNAFVIENQFIRAAYPKRAKDSNDLYHHMSDNDYIGLYSLPGSIDIEMIFDKDYLVDNSVKVPNTDYRLAEIPVDTLFYIGNYIFGLYYPIQIMINEITKSVTAIYGTEKINPLHSLNSNNVIKRDFTFSGVNFISVEFPIYQFEKITSVEIIQSNFGFRKQYQYDNNIYSVRVYNYKDGAWNELDYSLSNISYDPHRATAVLKITPENKLVEINIPQVYFTKKMIGNKIKVELYNTLGEIDVTVNTVNSDQISADYNFSSENTRLTYSNVLQNIPTSQINILSEKILGGSNGYDFETLKSRVIYGSSDNNVPITNLDLINFFSDRGFYLQKYKDNLTDRVFHAYKLLTDQYQRSVLGVNTRFCIHVDEIANDNQYSSVLIHEESMTILPNTVFKYDNDTNVAIILKDVELVGVDDLLTDSIIVDKLNRDTYLKGLYHISISTKEKYPYAESYDLITCSSKNLEFKSENTRIAAQANAISSAIRYYTINNNLELSNIEKDQGGYYLYIGINKSKDLATITEDKFLAYLSIPTKAGYLVGYPGEFISIDGDIYLYKFDIKSSLILKDDTISITGIHSQSPNQEHMVSLITKASISFHGRKEEFIDAINDSYINNLLLFEREKYLSISAQTIDIVFGTNLKSKINNSLAVNWSPADYERYVDDVYLTYKEDIYKKDENGLLDYAIDGETVELTVAHSKGSRILDEWGAEQLLHSAGDIIQYPSGISLEEIFLTPGLTEYQKNIIATAYNSKVRDEGPVISKERALDYIVECFMFDIRHFVADNTFNTTTCAILNSYYDTLSDIQMNILEETDCFFKVMDIIGNNTFKLNNRDTTILSLSLLFKMKCYITTNTYEKEDLTIISNNIIAIIKSHLDKTMISFIDIVNEIKSKLSDFILNIDIGGINERADLQTLINLNTNKKPSIRKELQKLEDGTMVFKDIIDIEYIVID